MVEAAVLRDAPAAGARAEAPLRLLVLTPKPKGVSPGQRFRLEQWAPRAAARRNVTLDFLPFESPGLTKVVYQPGKYVEKAARLSFDFLRRAGAVLRARRYDGVIVYREAAMLGPAIYERLVARLGVPLFFDFDDAIWAEGTGPKSGPNALFSKLHFWGKTATICRIASGVLVGNNYLADYARQHNDNVHVIPTSIELESYPVQPELPADDPFVVVWSGSTFTLPHFEHARPALEALAKKRRVVAKVIGNKPPSRPIAGAENVFVPWSENGEAESIGAAHVGIMPLFDDVFTRGKCGLKALQYMATGLPVVISPVGMNADLVEHGVNGYLAQTTEDLVERLDELARSPETRRRLGAAGRRTVEERYSAEVVSKLFADAVRGTIERRRAPT
ncbi:MAG: glycosyltransferase family 4 protein [Labilithrix sp.]|nr:glycosyltransferase family 4 protein [Labilithrix sp.]